MQKWTAEDLYAATAKQLAERAEVVAGRAWGADRGTPRIYMPSRRDCKVYFEFPDYPTGDEADLLGAPALTVWINECGQHRNWYSSQRAKLRAQFADDFDRLNAAYRAADDNLHGAPVTRDQAAAWRPGERRTVWYGGGAGEDNSERECVCEILAVTVEPESPGTIDPDPAGRLLVRFRDDIGDGEFYTWRGLLRYSSGAEVVRA